MSGELIGIRREDKNEWEARVPLTPEHTHELTEREGLRFLVQPSSIRCFADDSYASVGCEITEDLSSCKLVLAVKEIPESFFQPGGAYVFFSHTVKGQPYNMDMLRRLMAQGCHLIDYERILDDENRRLIFFGRFAGIAGMIDTLWAYGRRLRWEGTPNPFEAIHQTHRYGTVEAARQAVSEVGETIRREGLPREIRPLVCGFAGYGNVSQGAQEIYDLLPVRKISPEQLLAGSWDGQTDPHTLFKAEFHEKDMVIPADPGGSFDLQEYYRHPERYRGRFEDYIPGMTLFVNCIYWEDRYPRLMTKDFTRALFGSGSEPRLKVVGDISCDVEGAVECTVLATETGDPVFVWDPVRDRAVMGVEGTGPVMMTVDNLPCELPIDASKAFSEVLIDLLPGIADADLSVPFEACKLPAPVKRALIVYQGKLTPPYAYMEEFLAR